ncbi:hypothetical protein DC3_08620 [Deinococcus cellulosilyticus NBRC 106333 = KACC 11606]|uniref:Uncharacterized protein n=1 Tax=Deinococcus cellulosilyticus (strain DSM 18568 / NBRC 106333 / KACC 11606 / 5516J-15) TaxID=1223518 RepID=A0A511MYK9_DEIC1|nr:hypothetical protein DC3_08620 [Deinococcus cellulosilyticus NBRC 106333 = KACC 11606]
MTPGGEACLSCALRATDSWSLSTPAPTIPPPDKGGIFSLAPLSLPGKMVKTP